MTLGSNLMTSNFNNERAVKIVWGSLNKCICFRKRSRAACCGSEASPGWVSRKMITKLARNCQLSLARHWHECSWNLKCNPDSPGAPCPCWQPYLWSKHLTPYGLATLFYFQIKYWNSILDITHWPEFIAPSRWLWALQEFWRELSISSQTAVRCFGYKPWRIHNSDWQPNWPWRGNGRLQPSSIRHQTSRHGIQHSLNVIWTRFSYLSVVCVRINVRFVISLTKVSRVPE